MKRVLLTVAILSLVLSGATFAQQYGTPQPPVAPPYSQQPGYNQPNYNQPDYTQPGGGQPNYNYDYDDYRFDRHLDWWDRGLNLSRRQEREIRRIRDRFTQQTQTVDPRDPRQRDFFRQARQRQFFDMMAVLNPGQRDQVIARMRPYEVGPGQRWANQGNRYGNRPFGY